MERAIFTVPKKQQFKDEYLDRLLSLLNESRETVGLPKITYARLNLMLKKVEKSKKNWDRDVWIANVLDAKNPAKYFWYIIKSK